MGKSAGSISVIGGSDGPTSIFLSGTHHKDKNLIKRCKQLLLKKRYQYRMEKAKKLIQPGAHTLKEVISYIKKQYKMVEADVTNPIYETSLREMRLSLVQAEQMERLPKYPELNDYKDQESVERWMKKLDLWRNQVEKIVENLPSESFHMDYHLFLLDKGKDGSMQVEIELSRGLIAVQYSGNGFESIVKDIYCYYGVTREDIANQSKRYKELVTTLAMKR